MINEVIKDFDLLIKEGTIGFYNRCEINQIFGLEGGEPFNIFTLVTFEKASEITKDDKYLTTKLNKFDGFNGIKWGIIRYTINLEQCNDFFKKLINNNEFCVTTQSSRIGQLSFLKKQYIPPTGSTEIVQVNKLLKNNFDNGSYVIEAFDIKKENTEFLLKNPVLLNKFSEDITRIIPIGIGSLSDRLGNVIFQFPVRLFELKKSVIKPDKGFILDLLYDKAIAKIPKLRIIAFDRFDDVILDSNIQDVGNKVEILMSTSNVVEMKILDSENNLILSSDSFSTIKDIVIETHIVSNQNRVFKLNDEIIETKIYTTFDPLSSNPKKDMEQWVHERMYEDELKKLESTKAFVQYYGNAREKALNDIRYLLDMYGKNGVYLWDPYLNASDIKNTLYYTQDTNVPLKAITGLMNADENNKSSIAKKIKEELESDDKNYLFMNFELRGKIGSHGWNFHDRFLLFPLERPKVWSLGISINQIGESHHILQEVRHAQHVLNAFNKLWDELEYEECIIWKII